MSTSLCGKLCITPPKCSRKERRRNYYSCCSIVAATILWRCCVFRCESETTLFGFPKEDTTRNQWLSCIYNTVPDQFNPNIQMCVVHFTEDYFLNLGEYLTMPAVLKGCFYKVGQFQLCKDSLALQTHSL